MDKIRLDGEEAEMLDTYEAGEWRTIEEPESEARRYREYARATFKKHYLCTPAKRAVAGEQTLTVIGLGTRHSCVTSLELQR